MLTSQMVFNEINSIDDMDHVMGVRAALVAEMTIAASARKAARKVEKRLTLLLDFAARRALDGDD